MSSDETISKLKLDLMEAIAKSSNDQLSSDYTKRAMKFLDPLFIEIAETSKGNIEIMGKVNILCEVLIIIADGALKTVGYSDKDVVIRLENYARTIKDGR